LDLFERLQRVFPGNFVAYALAIRRWNIKLGFSILKYGAWSALGYSQILEDFGG